MLSVFTPYMHFQFVAYFPVWLMLHLNIYLLWSIEHARWDDGSYGCEQRNTRNSWQKLQRPWWHRWGRTYGRYGSIILAVWFLFDNNLQTPYIFSKLHTLLQSLWRRRTNSFLSLLSSFCFLENAELDALEADMDFESEAVPSYLQPEQESELNLPAAPTGHAAVPANQQQVVELLWENDVRCCILWF